MTSCNVKTVHVPRIRRRMVFAIVASSRTKHYLTFPTKKGYERTNNRAYYQHLTKNLWLEDTSSRHAQLLTDEEACNSVCTSAEANDSRALTV